MVVYDRVRVVTTVLDREQAEIRVASLSECLCVRHKLMAKEPRYATQTQGRSDD